MKKILTLTALATASLLIAAKSDAQVYSAPPPVYQEPYDDQGAYMDPNGYPSSDGVVYEDEFPGYAYYDFPAWDGHYRDYWYYAHYRPFFERRYAGYFNGGRFDRGRFLGARFGHGYGGGAYANRGYVNRGYAGGYANHGYVNRGYGGGGYVNHGGPVGHAYGYSGNFNRGNGGTAYANRGGFANRGGGFANHGGGFENHGGGGNHGGAARGGFGGNGGGHGGGHGGRR